MAIGSAGAYVGGSFSGPLPTSNAPDLRTATIVRTVHPSDALGGQAKFCFDQALNSTVNTGGFYLNDHDSARGHNGVGTATPDPQQPNCVTITFANGEDISQATTGVAETGAVRDVGNAPNPVASVPLAGSTLSQNGNLTSGRTDAPELIGVTPDVSQKQITYTFDEYLRPNNPAYMNPANFGFYINTSNGAAPITAAGGSIVQTSDSNVVVQFPGGVTNIGSAQQYFVLPGAVQDVPQNFGPAGGTPTTGGSVGTQINGSPGLDGAQMNGDHQTVNLHFSQGVNPGTASGVRLYREDGVGVLVANSISTTNDVNNQTLVATFPTDAQSDNGSLTRVVVLPTAATARSGGNGVTVGGAGDGNVGSFTPGFSDGPDLVYTEINDALNRAIFHYDEAVQSTPPPNPTSFFLFGPDGAPIAGQDGVVLSDSNKAVSVHFGSQVSATVGVANFFSAVTDETAQNNASQEASVGVGPAGCQPGSCPSPTPTASTTPSPTPTPKQHAPTSISAKHKKSSTKVTGKLGSSAPACKGGRSVSVKKGSKTIASGKSKASGAFSLKSKKAKGAGKGKLTVTAKARTIGNLICDGASKKV